MEMSCNWRYAIKRYIMNNNTNFAALSMNDIIFMDRNKSYGAYELRQLSNRNVRLGLSGTSLLLTLFIGYSVIIKGMGPKIPDENIDIISHPIENVKIEKSTVEVKKQMPPKGVSKPATSNLLAILLPKAKVEDQDTAIADPHAVEYSHTPGPGITGEHLGVQTNIEINYHAVPPKPEVKQSEPLNFAEVMPEFPGGENALLSYIGRTLIYPERERNLEIQGKVIVGFIINEAGKVSNVKILKGVSQGLDMEAMRSVRSLPDFRPGMQNGRPVKVYFQLPIQFRQDRD